MSLDALINSGFARFHDITTLQAERYAEGRRARRDGLSLPESRAISPEEAWYRAGWHDMDIEMGHRVMEDAA